MLLWTDPDVVIAINIDCSCRFASSYINTFLCINVCQSLLYSTVSLRYFCCSCY